MNWSTFFQTLPIAGWIAIFALICTVILALTFIFFLLLKKDVKLARVQIASKTQKELYQAEGKNLLDNQLSTAHNMLKKTWCDLYEAGKEMFLIKDPTELFLLEDISHLIEFKLNNEVKNDLTRNHITIKTDAELQKYSDAKAIGYYRSVKANLYSYNQQLPKYDLSKILEKISLSDYKNLFSEIYFSARKIAGESH